MTTKFNAKAVAANLARYAAANREPTLAEQIASPEVWGIVEQMLAGGFSLKDVAAGLVASGIEAKESAVRTTISKIRSDRNAMATNKPGSFYDLTQYPPADEVPATTEKAPEAVALDEDEAA